MSSYDWFVLGFCTGIFLLCVTLLILLNPREWRERRHRCRQHGKSVKSWQERNEEFAKKYRQAEQAAKDYETRMAASGEEVST
ncbi:MAG: hypothetical protein FWD91_00880 [Treponema sp.]|nr:hypothetical protein [Treponema sp.]